MGLILNSKDEFFEKVPLKILGILLFGIGPLILSWIGTFILTTKHALTHDGPCVEGDCDAGAIAWLIGLTIPIAILMFLVLIICLLVDYWRLSKVE